MLIIPLAVDTRTDLFTIGVLMVWHWSARVIHSCVVDRHRTKYMHVEHWDGVRRLMVTSRGRTPDKRIDAWPDIPLTHGHRRMICSVDGEELAGAFMHGRSLNGGQRSLRSPVTEAEDPRPEGAANQRLPARPLVNNDRYDPDERQLYSIAVSSLIVTMIHMQSDKLLSSGALNPVLTNDFHHGRATA